MKYTVLVKPGSSQAKVVSGVDGTLTVYLHARAHDGEANTALIAALARHFHVAKSRVSIVSGAHSRHKIVDIATI